MDWLLLLESSLQPNFIPIDKKNDDICAEIKSLPAATRKMYDMVTDFFGSAVNPVEPYLLYSTDDTTEYIFERTKQAFVPYVLTSTSSAQQWAHLPNCLYRYWFNRERNANWTGVHSRQSPWSVYWWWWCQYQQC